VTLSSFEDLSAIVKAVIALHWYNFKTAFQGIGGQRR
jgi:hypothetical protein